MAFNRKHQLVKYPAWGLRSMCAYTSHPQKFEVSLYQPIRGVLSRPYHENLTRPWIFEWLACWPWSFEWINAIRAQFKKLKTLSRRDPRRRCRGDCRWPTIRPIIDLERREFTFSFANFIAKWARILAADYRPTFRYLWVGIHCYLLWQHQVNASKNSK